MTDEALRRAYQAGLPIPEPGRAQCPPPEALSALVQREGDETERLAVLDHVMGCPACRRDFELVRAVHGASRPQAARRLPTLALAASIAAICALSGVLLWQTLEPRGPDPFRGAATEVELAAPDSGAVVTRPLLLVWHAVPNASAYTVELLGQDGRLVQSWETGDTSVAVPRNGAPRVPPGEYAWWVRARLSDGSERRSPVIPLELR